MEQDLDKKLKEIIGDIECPKGFKCCTEGLENLCKALDVGLDLYLECLEENAMLCSFSIPFGAKNYCKCPIRVYIAKKLRK